MVSTSSPHKGKQLTSRHPAAHLDSDHFCSAVLKTVQTQPAGLFDEGFAAPNGRHHFISGTVNHSVCAHLCLRLGAGSEICRPLRRERKLLDPMVGSFLHLYGESVESFRRVRRVQQTIGWALTGSDIYVTTNKP